MATALLFVSGASMWILMRGLPSLSGKAAGLYFASASRGISKLAKYSLLWILIAGVPRAVFYRQYEWYGSASGLMVFAIVIKHILMFLIVGTGIYYWTRVNRRVRQVEEKFLPEVK